ncbi:LysR family transcriptional regulator [Ponticaulis sp.]|uniref:LysR family transcriptional regulator n=1 Tax=Ponticaulis sp. TaxID=2020902 RepID=UPI000B69EFE9|nr:LysR family transcriptional regulator [Ponticaulis sp.]MAI90343.1 LysR family transcriptional regulator [Ponticaulis sp.]OUX99979.1 MAG: hypothetical protein CBB65_07880 [Hyphomonadaceae bacterium TMED5]
MRKLTETHDFLVFDAIARTGSLSAAAEQLGMSLSAVSRRLQHIEGRLDLRLVNRTTRTLSLTTEGEEFSRRAASVLDSVHHADEMSDADTCTGTIRLTASVAFAQRQLAPRLAQFQALHPKVSFELITTDRLIDLVENKLDLAIRQSYRGGADMIARRIAGDGEIYCASPEYVSRHGAPSAPSDLSSHRALCVGNPPPRVWPLNRDDKHIDVPITPTVTSTDGEVVHTVALKGGGVVLKSAWDVIDDIRSGKLVRVLPDWWGRPKALRALLPMRKHQPERVRIFLDWLQVELRSAQATNADLGIFPPDD